jgi:hypothetical protein
VESNHAPVNPIHQLAVAGVAVEKLDIHKNGMILGDSKWSVAPATLFWPSFRS